VSAHAEAIALPALASMGAVGGRAERPGPNGGENRAV